ARCSAAGGASERCGLLTGNVLAAPASSPFRHGYLRQYGVSASGGSTSKRYSVAAQWDGFGGVYGLPGGEQARLATTGGLRADVLNPTYQQRTDTRGSGQLVSSAPGRDPTRTRGSPPWRRAGGAAVVSPVRSPRRGSSSRLRLSQCAPR